MSSLYEQKSKKVMPEKCLICGKGRNNVSGGVVHYISCTLSSSQVSFSYTARQDFKTYKHNQCMKKMQNLCGMFMTCFITPLKINLCL